MQRGKVESSFIKSIGYEHESRILEVEIYKNNLVDGKKIKETHIYQYFGIAPATFAALITAHSIGGYFNRYIRKDNGIEIIENSEMAVSEFSLQEIATTIIDELFRRINIKLSE